MLIGFDITVMIPMSPIMQDLSKPLWKGFTFVPSEMAALGHNGVVGYQSHGAHLPMRLQCASFGEHDHDGLGFKDVTAATEIIT